MNLGVRNGNLLITRNDLVPDTKSGKCSDQTFSSTLIRLLEIKFQKLRNAPVLKHFVVNNGRYCVVLFAFYARGLFFLDISLPLAC